MIPIKCKYTFDEILAYQKLPLSDKIKTAVAVLKEVSTLSNPKNNVALAFSGGKDSEVVADLIERFVPELHDKIYCIFGNTGCEFPESLQFARKYGKEHYGDRFRETKPLKLDEPELRYDFAKTIVAQLEEEDALDEILKPDGKMKGQKALIEAAKKRDYFLDSSRIFEKGHTMNFRYCLEQYGLPLLGKSASKLDAHRINIDCFLKYSESATEDEKLKDYYDVLKECKFSQHCCKLLKKEPSERLQSELGVDVIIKGLMAAESHSRMVSISVRGHIFESTRPHIKNGSFYHCSPLAMWTDDDIWQYIHTYSLDYSPLYDMTYEGTDGEIHHIERNGCMFCGTDIQFKDNHLSVLRQTHPKAYDVCMERYGYQDELSKLFRMRKDKGILEAMNERGTAARLINRAGNSIDARGLRPCLFDDYGEMVNLDGTGLDNEYDPEEPEQLFFANVFMEREVPNEHSQEAR